MWPLGLLRGGFSPCRLCRSALRLSNSFLFHWFLIAAGGCLVERIKGSVRLPDDLCEGTLLFEFVAAFAFESNDVGLVVQQMLDLRSRARCLLLMHQPDNFRFRGCQGLRSFSDKWVPTVVSYRDYQWSDYQNICVHLVCHLCLVC